MVLVPFYQSKGLGPATEAARRKCGTVFDPEVVEAFLAASRKDEFRAGLAASDLWDTVLEMEPKSSAKFMGEESIEDVALAFADFADMKTGHKPGHSRSTAEVAGAVADRMRLPPGDGSDRAAGGPCP